MRILTSALLLTLTVLTLLPTPAAKADEAYTIIIKKQEEKKKNRFSFQDYLDQRDHMRLLDLWLVLHSPSPYEFYIGGSYQAGTYNGGQFFHGYDLSAAAYISLVGVKVQRDDTTLDARWYGTINLRILGFHDQATNLTLLGGYRNEARNGDSYGAPLFGVAMTVYLLKQFGAEFLYHHYFDSAVRGNGAVVGGNRYEAGAFIDFSFVRVYADYVYDLLADQYPTGVQHTLRSGFRTGVRLYF